VKPYRFHADALAEYEAAATWYAERSIDASRRFVKLIEGAVATAREFPLAGPGWRGRADVRVRALRRVPYSVVYMLAAGQLVVIAVAHQRRRPGYWLGRLSR
jgi:plasmid stabilization system protein ParE